MCLQLMVCFAGYTAHFGKLRSFSFFLDFFSGACDESIESIYVQQVKHNFEGSCLHCFVVHLTDLERREMEGGKIREDREMSIGMRKSKECLHDEGGRIGVGERWRGKEWI